MSFVLIFINVKMNIVLLYLIIVFRVLNNIYIYMCYSFTFVRKIHYIFVLIEIVLTVTTMK